MLQLLEVALFQDPPLRHGNGNVKSILRTLDIRLVLTRDVECCTMGRRCHRHGQSTLYRHSTIKRQQLHRDLTLVVIHCDDSIEMLTFQEDSIAGIWSLDIDAVLSTCFYSRTDMIDLLTPKGTILAVMGI